MAKLSITFEEALYQLKLGNKVARDTWGEVWAYLFHVPAGATTIPHKLGSGYSAGAAIWLKTPDDTIEPWMPTQADLLSDDWYVVDNPVRQDQLISR
jgi:hypothetical protein